MSTEYYKVLLPVALHTFSHLIFTTMHELGIILILLMRKQNPRKASQIEKNF